MQDVIVIGGGAMGSAAALSLTRAGRKVLLLERFWPGHDRGGSHGATRIFRLVYDEPDYVTLAQRALSLWRELEAESGARLLTPTGAIDHGQFPLAERTELLASLAVPFEVLDPSKALSRWPGIAFETPVLHQPDGGRLHADTAVHTLQRLAVLGGARVHFGQQVTGISVSGDSVEVRTGDEVLTARHVVVAAGPWAPTVLRGVIDLPALTVTQEQPAHFAVHADLDWPSFVHWRPGFPDSYGLFAPGEGVKVST